MTHEGEHPGGRPRLVDFYCCAGGCTRGYQLAGFHVTGVDLVASPNYCGDEFVQGDALELLADPAFMAQFRAVAASPPCQGYTTMSNKHPERQSEWPRLIEPTRELLIASGLPYVMENVEGAASAMRTTLRLHGGHFGLGVHRPRLFESNVLLMAPQAARVKEPVGVYGKLDGRRVWTRADGSEQRSARTVEEGGDAMGIDWMTWDELREAIPPAYCEFIGAQLRHSLVSPAP